MTMKFEGHTTPPYLQAIGRICINFSHLESIVESFTWDLIGPDQRLGQILTTERSFRQVRELASCIWLEKFPDPEMRKSFADLLNRIGEIEARRNQIIHSTWYPGESRETITRVKVTAKMNKGYHLVAEQMSVEALNQFAEEIAAANWDVLQFRMGLGSQLDYASNPKDPPAGRVNPFLA
jgi:hypothetical protein